MFGAFQENVDFFDDLLSNKVMRGNKDYVFQNGLHGLECFINNQ